MAEFLVKATDYRHPMHERDMAGAYKRGMLVEARENGAKYGTAEGPPKFIVIRVPELPLAKARELCQERRGQRWHSGTWVGQVWVDGRWEEDVIRRRHYVLDITGLTHGQVLTVGEFWNRLKEAK